MLVLLVQAPPLENHWAKRSLLFSATVHSCASWPLAAVFLAIFKTWPIPTISNPGRDSISFQQRHPPVYHLPSPPTSHPSAGLTSLTPGSSPTQQTSILLPPTSLTIPPSRNSYVTLRKLVPRVDVRAWISLSHLKNQISIVLPRTMATQTIAADFLIRAVSAYFMLMRTVVCFDWVVFIPFPPQSRRRLCLQSRGWITIQSCIVRHIHPFREHLFRPPVLREMPRRARLKLTNDDLSLQSCLWTSNSQVPPSRYQDGGSRGYEQSGFLAICLKLRKQAVAWQRSHLPATEILAVWP